MKKIISFLIAVILAFSSISVFALDLNDAYDEVKTLHPEFVNSLISHGIPEATITYFIFDVYDYIMEINATTPVTRANFETHAMTAITRVSARTEYTALQDALLILYPNAIRLALTEGKVDDDFKPLIDTIKRILFPTNESDGLSEPSDTPIEPEMPPVEEKSLFSDIDKSHWAYDAVNTLAKNLILNGYLDGTFKPDNNITRAEFAKIVVSAADCFDTEASSSFTDVSENDWYYSYVSTAYKNGYITGYPDGSFRPNDNISRADICTIVNRIIKTSPGYTKTFVDTDDIPTYARDAVYALSSKKIINGFSDGTFKPTASATRAQTAKIIYSAFFSK